MLGSMIYDLFTIHWNGLSQYLSIYKEPRYIVKISIVLFYLFDYYYLHFFVNVDKKSGEHQKKGIFVFIDLLVSVFLLISFKCYTDNPTLATILICLLTPLGFLIYSYLFKKNATKKQKKTLDFFIFYSIIFFVGGIVFLILQRENNRCAKWKLCYLQK